MYLGSISFVPVEFCCFFLLYIAMDREISLSLCYKMGHIAIFD